MPTPIRREGSDYFWIRKRVPDRYRPIVGRNEVWRSLETKDARRAKALCLSKSIELEDEWEAMKETAAPSSVPAEHLTHEEVWSLAGEFFLDYVEQHRSDPGHVVERERAVRQHEERVRRTFPYPNWKMYAYWGDILSFLRKKGRRLDTDSLQRFGKAYYQRRGEAEQDLLQKARGIYGKSPIADQISVVARRIPAVDAFERYSAATGLKARSAIRWRPVFDHLVKFLGHNDLAKVKKADLVKWKNHLLEEKGKGGELLRVPRTVRDVWLAAVRAVTTYLVDEDELTQNPAGGIVVRGVEVDKDDDEKGFTDEDAATILRATLIPQSKNMSVEMAAAHRWVPWIAAYTGARVNEITSLRPQDFMVKDGFQCIHLRKEVTKTSQPRTIPLHDHLLRQDGGALMVYVAERRKLGKPLFYDPGRARKTEGRSKEQYEKVASKLGDWVRSMDGVDHAIWPNHGWRHRWKAKSRHVEMHPVIADFIQGHGGGSVSKKYGPKWVKTFAKQIAKLPAYRIEITTAARRPRTCASASPSRILNGQTGGRRDARMRGNRRVVPATANPSPSGRDVASKSRNPSADKKGRRKRQSDISAEA